MKKLFISCPMSGRTNENIRKSMEFMHKYAELVTGEELEVIDSYMPGTVVTAKNTRVYMLGESIKLMAEADYVVGIGFDDQFPGCEIEWRVSREYGIPFINCVYHLCKVFEDIPDE